MMAIIVYKEEKIVLKVLKGHVVIKRKILGLVNQDNHLTKGLRQKETHKNLKFIDCLGPHFTPLISLGGTSMK